MIRNTETMRLVSNTLNQIEPLRVTWQYDGVRRARYIDFLCGSELTMRSLFFRYSYGGNVELEPVHHFHGGVKLALTTVDDDQIRQRPIMLHLLASLFVHQ